MRSAPGYPTVSVALCTYNGAAHVREQVASILAQSPPVAEVVLSDDGSRDATVATVREVVGEFLRANPRAELQLVVIENAKPLGVRANFEQAVRACSGELIALCDQDDVWLPGRVSTAIEQFLARPELTLLHANARLVDDEGAPLGYSLFDSIEFTAAEQAEVHEGRAFNTLLRRNVVTGATAMFRRTLLSSGLPFAESWVHDEWLGVLASVVGRTDFLAEPVIDYRQHNANQIGARKPTFAQKLGRLRAPRDERNDYLVARAEALLARLVELGDIVPATVIERATRKVTHERRRRDYPALRVARVLPILLEALRGGYRDFGRARYDLVRDLTQPHRRAAR